MSGASAAASAPCGTFISSTMMVMITAMTPSLKASSRPLLISCPRFAKAGVKVIVDHADRLHEGIADRRADELEAALQEIFAKSVRLGGLRRHIAAAPPAVDARSAADEAPDVGVEA